MTQARRTGPALETMYRFLLWLVPAVEKFPRRQKFLLGDRIQELSTNWRTFPILRSGRGQAETLSYLTQGMLQAVNGAPLL